MESRIGIIAGSGKFPFFILEEARKKGFKCVIAAIKGEAEDGLEDKADIINWFDVNELQKLISFFKKYGIEEALFAGKIDHRIIFNKEKFKRTPPQHLIQSKTGSPAALIHAIIGFLANEGILIMDPTPYLTSFLCRESILTETEPSPEVEENISFGWKIVKEVADLDIGQTLIVKDKAVVAVEGIEGTDEAIKRGGQLVGEGTVVLKISRSFQDPRVDLPAVGLDTVRHLVEAKAKALCFEAEKIPFFQKNEAISLANSNKISIVAKKLKSQKSKLKTDE